MTEFEIFCASAASPLWYASSASPGPRATAARSFLVEGKTELSESVAKTKRIFTSDGRFEKYAVIPPLVVPLLPLVVLLVLVLLVFMMAVSIAVMRYTMTRSRWIRIRTYTA